MKYYLLLAGLLAIPRFVSAQTDSCKVFETQFSKHIKTNNYRSAAIALSRYADCYQHKVTTEVEQDSLLLFWALAGSLYDTGKEPDLARQHWQKVITYYEANPNPNFLERYTLSLMGHVQQYFLVSKRTESLQFGAKLYNIPIAQLQAAQMKSLSYYIGGLQYTCLLLRREGKLELAERYVHRMINTLEALHIPETQSEYKQALLELGNTRQEMGEFAEAEQIFQKLYAQLRMNNRQPRLEWASELAILLGSRLSQLKGSMGQAEQRELMVRQCLSEMEPILARYSAPDSAEVRKTGKYNVFLIRHGGLLGELARTIEDRGAPEEATDLYLKSLAEIGSTSFSLASAQRTADYLITLGNIGFSYGQRGNYPLAGEYLHKSLSLADTVFGRSSFSFAQAQVQMYSSDWGRRQGQLAIDRCLEALSQPQVPKNQAYSLMLSNVSLVMLANGQYRQADSLLTIAWVHAQARHPFVSEMTQLIVSKKLHAAINRRQFSLADSLFGQLLTVNRTLLLNRFLGLTEGEKQRLIDKSGYRNQMATYTLQRLSNNPGLADTLYNQQLDYKGVLLWSSRKVQAALRQSTDTRLQATFGAYQRIRQQLSVVSSLSEQQRRGLRVDSLERVANQFEKELVARLPGFANQRSRYTWQQVQARLRPGQAALEMVRFRLYAFDSAGHTTDAVRYAALLLKPGFTHPKIILLSEGNQLETTWLRDWQQHILKKQPDKLSYGRYWQTIARELMGVKRLYFSPDGVYHQLNPASLYNPASHQYVLDELEFTLLTTTRDLAQPVSNRASTASALLVGFPAYTLDGGKREFLQLDTTNTVNTRAIMADYAQPAFTRSEVWQPLPGTKREVEQIGALLNQKQYHTLVLTGDQAREGALKARPNPTILHLATHAFFKSDSSRRVLGSQNPMLRAGLVLAGAQQRVTTLLTLLNPKTATDDGILTALEAADLTLDSTQLVVLSACQTGLGVVRTGEGVYGLQRAFRMAGAKAILMSLWKVNDTATQRLMTLFYRNWLNGQSKVEALRQAQQQLRQQRGYESPYFWGAFVLAGQ